MTAREFLDARALGEAQRYLARLTSDGQQIVSALSSAAEIAPEVTAMAGLDPRFVTGSAALPRNPTAAELAALPTGQTFGGAHRPAGLLQRLAWDRTGGQWTASGQPLVDLLLHQQLTASLARVRVDATQYGVAEDADVSTFMAAVAATPDGGTLTCPRVKLTHNGGRLIINGRRGLIIEANGLTVTARSDLPDSSAGENGGFYFVNCEEIDVWDMTYDGRLDTRTPYGSDMANTNLKSGWNVLSGCRGVRLHNVWGNRCMMDGIYIGHVDDTLPAQFPGASVTQANMPINTVLDRCGGDGNYRQGLSVVGCNGLTGSGNKFHRTGKTGGKGTLPMAGVDFEAYTASGFFNLGVDLTDTECNENVGHAVLFEQGTDGAVLRGVRGTGNGGGIGFAGQARNCEVTSLTLSGSGINPVEPINVVIGGVNNHVRGGTITCADGSRAGVIKADGFLCGIHGVTSISAPGTLHTGTFMSDGAEAQFTGLTAVDGRQPGAGYGVVDMRGVGSRLSGLRVVGYNGDTTSIPVVMLQGRAEQPSISGYSVPADLRVSGTRLPTAGVALGLTSGGGRAVTISNPSATLERSVPDSLLYRVVIDVVTGAAGTEPFVVLALGGYGTYVPRILSVGALDNNSAEPITAGPLSAPDRCILATAPSAEQSIRVTLIVELTR